MRTHVSHMHFLHLSLGWTNTNTKFQPVPWALKALGNNSLKRPHSAGSNMRFVVSARSLIQLLEVDKCVLHPEWIMNLQWFIHIHPRCIKCVLLQAVVNNENVCINIYTFLLWTATTVELKKKKKAVKSRRREGICMQVNVLYLDCIIIQWKMYIYYLIYQVIPDCFDK